MFRNCSFVWKGSSDDLISVPFFEVVHSNTERLNTGLSHLQSYPTWHTDRLRLMQPHLAGGQARPCRPSFS